MRMHHDSFMGHDSFMCPFIRTMDDKMRYNLFFNTVCDCHCIQVKEELKLIASFTISATTFSVAFVRIPISFTP